MRVLLPDPLELHLDHLSTSFLQHPNDFRHFHNSPALTKELKMTSRTFANSTSSALVARWESAMMGCLRTGPVANLETLKTK